jgi:hypothetical protein
LLQLSSPVPYKSGTKKSGYSSVIGLTTISGDMTVSSGTVVIGDIILQ